MHSSAFRVAGLVLGLAVTVGTAQESQHRSTPFSEASITVQNRADADGYVRFRVQPVGGQAVEATVDVLQRMGENDIADDIAKALTVALPSAYRASTAGGENVRIRKEDRAAADFTIEVAFNTPGLQILLSN